MPYACSACPWPVFRFGIEHSLDSTKINNLKLQLLKERSIMEEIGNTIEENDVLQIVIQNAKKSPMQRYKPKSIKLMSIVHLCCGTVIFCIDIVKIFVASERDEVALAGFCSSFFIITGIVGFLTLRGTNPCKISAFMVTSILSSVFGGLLFLTALHTQDGYYSENVIYSMFAFFGLFELILGIVSAAFTCCVCCSCCGRGSVKADENSVVYIPSPEEGNEGKARVVHINMNEIRKTKVTDEPTILGKDDHVNVSDETVNEQKENSYKYARFK